MSRLIAFGCSLTFGHGLPDCHQEPNQPGKQPSKYVWPEVIAKRLGRICINLSEPGSSNKRIWHNVINFKFKKDDIVFILWTYNERWCLLKNKNFIVNYGPWQNTLETLYYYDKIYADYDAMMQTKLYVSHVNFLLKEKNITLYNLTTKKSTAEIFKLSGQTVPHIPLYICDTYRQNYPLALDNKHPGVECNEVYANDIMPYINNKSNNKTLLEKIKCMLT
jgi:hypothetical protein